MADRCDSKAAFDGFKDALDGLCRSIDSRDPLHLAGPIIQRVIFPLAILALVYGLGRVARRVLERAVSHAGGDSQVRTLVHNVLTAATWGLAILSALVASGLDISVLLTFGGLASLAVGLAFQDLLRNVLAGIFLLLERPFRIGDFITVDRYSGTVQTIQLRTTALRTAAGELAVLPNLVAFNGIVLNSSAYEKRRYTVRLRLPEAADLEAVRKAARRDLARVREIASTPPLALSAELVLEGALLRCDFWLDRTYDGEALSAEVSRRLWLAAEGSRRPGAPDG